MRHHWKRDFIYYSVLAGLALSTVVATTLKVNVKPVAAQGSCHVVVGEDGATCDNGGSNPGGAGTGGGSTPGSSNPGTENPGSSGGSGGSNSSGSTGLEGCTPGSDIVPGSA